MPRHHLAQLNVGIIKAPLDSAVMADFVANLDRVNALAEASPGFVWRLQTSEGNATALRPTEDESFLVNMSVWEDADALRRFVYNSAHLAIMRRRGEWFQRMADAYLVLWWMPIGHTPTVEEALARLERLRADGPTPHAFTFRAAFHAPDAESAAQPLGFDDTCPAT